MNGLSENRLLAGYWKEYLRFKGITLDFVGMMIMSINKFKDVDSDDFGDHGKHISEFFEYINKITVKDDKSSLARQVHDLMNELADKVKWNTINNQLNRTRKNVDAIVKSINKISIQKATMLQKNLQLLSNAKTAEQLQKCIAEMEQLISTIIEYQDRQEKSNAKLTNTVAEALGVDDKEKAKKNGIIYDKNGNIDKSRTDIKSLLLQVITLLTNIDNQSADGKSDLDVYVTNWEQIAKGVAGDKKYY